MVSCQEKNNLTFSDRQMSVLRSCVSNLEFAKAVSFFYSLHA